MKRLLMVLALLCSACATSSSVAKSKDPAQKGAVAAVDETGQDPNELLCTMEMELGSHIPEKVCRTRWQIEEERRSAQEVGSRPGAGNQALKPGG